jgi:hypothetical protein
MKEDEIGNVGTTHGKDEKHALRNTFGKPEGDRLLRRPRRRWGTILKWMLRKSGGK